MTDIASAKSALREEILKKRMAAHRLSRDRAAVTVRDLLLSTLPLQPGAKIAGYWPLSGELDTVPAMEALHAKKYTVCLPVVTGNEQPLIFRIWQPDMKLAEGYSGTRTPPAHAAETRPNILLVPLIAFDRAGYRLGYGGGFYDRTINDLRQSGGVTAVGIAYAAQQVAQVPHDRDDARLDWIITEDGAFACS